MDRTQQVSIRDVKKAFAEMAGSNEAKKLVVEFLIARERETWDE